MVDSSATGRKFYLPELDGLRFLAFFIVFLGHNGTATKYFGATTEGLDLGVTVFDFVAAWAWVGVDLFFVLSSFLITSLLTIEKSGRGRIDFKAFYIRRVLRIWPLYFLAILLGFFVLPAFGWYGIRILDSQWQLIVQNHLIPFLFFFANFSILRHEAPMSPMLGPLWSVSIEEQFYIVWPFLVSYSRPKLILLFCLLMIATAICSRILLSKQYYSATYYNTFARLDPIALGAIGAILFPWIQRRISSWVEKLLLIALFLTGTGIILCQNIIFESQKSNIWTFLFVAVVALLLLISTILISPLRKFFGSSRMIWLGRISYGLYIFMNLSVWIGDQIVRWIIPGPSWLGFVLKILISLATCVLISALSYEFIEKRFLLLKMKFSKIESRPI